MESQAVSGGHFMKTQGYIHQNKLFRILSTFYKNCCYGCKTAAFVEVSVGLDASPLFLGLVAWRRRTGRPMVLEKWSNLLWVLVMLPCCAQVDRMLKT